jgi:twitching motility protein PilT
MSPQSTAQRTEWSRRLARGLRDAGFLDELTAVSLLAEATETGAPLGFLLIARGVVPARVVVSALAKLADLATVDLTEEVPDARAAEVFPPQLSLEYHAISVRFDGPELVVAFAEPPEPETLGALTHAVGYPIRPVLSSPVAIIELLNVLAHPFKREDEAPEAPAPSAPQSGSSLGARSRGEELPLHIDELLRYAVSLGASDLHLTADMPPSMRIHGALRPIEEVGPLDNSTLRDMIFGILPQVQREQFEETHELDTSHSISDVGRFRVNVGMQRGMVTVALRPIPHEIPEFSTLGLPESIQGFAELRRGLVLVTGPTGSGKSTTLASIIDIVNRHKPMHIVTIEDPIEFLHTHKRSVISQREVGSDTASFSEALRRALRQDPDVILVGEMRDLETIATALTAAETGHLVFATLHTQNAPSTIDRVIDVFPPEQQEQIRIQLASSLQGVVTQQLVPTADGSGRCVASEVLFCTPAIKNLIRAGKTHQIYSLMQTGGQYGMQTMDQALAVLVRRGAITRGVAIDRCLSEEDFRNHLRDV